MACGEVWEMVVFSIGVEGSVGKAADGGLMGWWSRGMGLKKRADIF